MLFERDIEKKLVKEIKKRGGKVLKQTGEAGTPDRLVLSPLGLAAFVELKRPGEKPRKLQLQRIKELKELGFDCYVIDSLLEVEKFIDRLF